MVLQVLGNFLEKDFFLILTMSFKSRKHSIESLKQLAIDKDWELLSEKYLGGSVKHDFKCNKGHRIKKTIEHFLNGSGCSVCSGKARLTIEDFRAEARKNGWELLSTEYNGVTQMLHFHCNHCDNDFSKISSYLRGKKKVKFCPNCDPLKKKTLEEMKFKAAKKGFECLSSEYIGIEKKLLWRCKYKHEWSASPNDVFNSDSGCPECKRFKTEAKIKYVFESYFEGKKFSKKSKIKTGYEFSLELDGFNPELNIAFEYNGIQHYEYSPFYHQNKLENFEKQKLRDAKKIEYCRNNNIHLIIIPYKVKSDVELADFILKALPENITKDKDKLFEILENYGRDSDELAPIREKLTSINMVLLSNTYSSVIAKNQLIKCLKCEVEYLSSDYLIKRMVKCRNCVDNKTFTIDDVKKIATDNNITLVSTDYIPQKKVTWRCPEGHLWDATPTSVKGTRKKKGTNCPHCFGKTKTTIEDVKNLAIKRGHTCLSESIVNRDSVLSFECRRKEGEIHVWPTTFNSYKNSVDGCLFCTGKKKFIKP
jgi:hypothetical protein